MAKITIISSIIAAVCVFQTAEAVVFDKLLGGSPLENALQQHVSNTLESVKEQGTHEWEVSMKDFKNGLKTSQKIFSIPAACTDLSNEIREVAHQMRHSFHDCYFNKTPSVSPDTEELNNTVNNLEENLLKLIEDTDKCVQSPFNIMSCLTNVSQKKASELDPLFEKAMMATSNLFGIITNVRKCFDTAIHVFCHNMDNLVDGVIQCVQRFFSSQL